MATSDYWADQRMADAEHATTPHPKFVLFPKTAERPEQIRGFIRGSEVFHVGDRVVLIHRASGSKLHGVLGGIYGVGRVRGFKIIDVPFTSTGTACYPMGKPGDEAYGLSVIERGEESLAAARAYFLAHDGTAEAWDTVNDFGREVYLNQVGVEGKL